MENNKPYTDMNADELRAAISEYQRSVSPVPDPAALPPGITADMSQKSQEEAARLYYESIMKKPAGILTEQERNFLRSNVTAALRTMGY